uniref:Poly(rC) binding protein 3 n=1 Tax=Pan troglodytes TaxID=9598 RepID=A0A2I3RND3_PANTR
LGDAFWAPSVLPHSTLSALSHHPQPQFGRRMESKVSEGGLNVTLTIRLLMHGKVRGAAIVSIGKHVSSILWESGLVHRINNLSPTDASQAFAMIAYKFEEDIINSMSQPCTSKPQPVRRPDRGKGSRFKEISAVAGDMLPNSTERAVTISGTPRAIIQCVKLDLCGYTIPGQYSHQLTKLHQLAMQQTPFPPLGQTNPAFPGEKLPLHSSEEAQNLMGQSSGLDASPPASTHELTIPNDLIGCIIGRQGTKINEIRQMSGAQIKIANATEGSSERQITITGTPANISLAQYLINARLTSEVTGMGTL